VLYIEPIKGIEQESVLKQEGAVAKNAIEESVNPPLFGI